MKDDRPDNDAPAGSSQPAHQRAAGHGHDTPAQDANTPRRRGRSKAVLVLPAIAAALLAVGILPRLSASAQLTTQVAAQARLPVEVITPRAAPATQELLLPGSVMPYAEASIFARTSGYLAHWYSDIGAHVKAGDTLAVIETPELDAQLRQGRADEATAQANSSYANVTAQRWQDMLKTKSISQQEVDTKVSDMLAKRAMLAAAQANVARLTELVSYEKVRAPFDGVVTARNVDVGALVNAGGAAGTPATGELFHVAQTATLRVYVNVPQDDAPYAQPNTPVYLTVQQFPGKRFAGSVVRNAGAMDPSSRTLRVEVDVDNHEGLLLPGAYAQVHLLLKSSTAALDVPVSTLLFRPNGVDVAVVGSDDKVVVKTVHIGRDFGTHLEILSGLAATDRVINNPGDSLSAGQLVQIAQPRSHN
jgi:RND family efflux transporter MFP subunit